MPELIAPTAELHQAWLEAHHEWGPGPHEDGFGLDAEDEVESGPGFAAWVARLADEPDPARALCTFRWIVEDGRVLGGIALRHRDDDFTRRAGHIGYGIRPSARRRGRASWALGRVLDLARTAGRTRVLLVCEAGNHASARTIERQGGIRESGERGPEWRYWIDLAGRAPEPDGHRHPPGSG
ncbi:GNAT family N-acetyltransferase [Amycolatopsis sp. PS_44_ISF1]|uniref:GNAT family N-acetyltransferase n=1 Tax=Amycolatopsis sp. PS_44_ISF1 TaxID=2974917 RepID=UPI0028DF1310|nr:GNAT family N-acetyltransferase [Amycolatopsis sp. PS_44_ISF1]MDT8913298.1 GNAT family N-acetyltransferase [Amycolatopsis sp. PS_44_ISF1]